MTPDDPRKFVMLSDALTLRRAAYVSLLDPWATSNKIEIRAEDEGPASRVDHDRHMALEILVLGAARIDDPAVQAQLLHRRRTRPDVPLALVSDYEDRAEVTAAFRQGARGFVPSSLEPDLAREAFGFILAGGTFFPPHILDRPAGDGGQAKGRGSGQAVSLTPRQLDVLALLREGKSNKLIARDLSMCESTVKVHVRQIMRKLGAANRTQAALSRINGAGSNLAVTGFASPDVAEGAPFQVSQGLERRNDEHYAPLGLQQARAR